MFEISNFNLSYKKSYFVPVLRIWISLNLYFFARSGSEKETQIRNQL